MRIRIVDAFTSTPFSGNPAGVVVLDSFPDASWMQRVAAEVNHSETAFVHPLGEVGDFALRWFTPAVEVALCGHATLATAHVLGCDRASIRTLSGTPDRDFDRRRVVHARLPDRPAGAGRGTHLTGQAVTVVDGELYA